MSFMKNIGWLILGVAGLLTSCSTEEDMGLSFSSDNYDFNTATHGWEVDYANYRADSLVDSTIYKFSSGYTELPANLGGRKALKVSGNNADGKLMMFLRKKVGGFQPNTDYTLALEVEFASSARADKPEGSKVLLQAGAFDFEPKKVIRSDKYLLDVTEPNYFNGGVSNAGGSGSGMIALGSIGTTASGNEYSDKYSILVLNTSNISPSLHIRSNSNGEIWLIVGTESMYRGVTTLYYTRISYVLSVSN